MSHSDFMYADVHIMPLKFHYLSIDKYVSTFFSNVIEKLNKFPSYAKTVFIRMLDIICDFFKLRPFLNQYKIVFVFVLQECM